MSMIFPGYLFGYPVHIVIFDKKSYKIEGKIFDDIKTYIDDCHVDKHTDYPYDRSSRSEAIKLLEFNNDKELCRDCLGIRVSNLLRAS